MSENILPPIPDVPVGAGIIPPVQPVIPSVVEGSPLKKRPTLLLLLIPVMVIVAVIAIYVLLQARTMYQQTVAVPTPTSSPTPVASTEAISNYVCPQNGWQNCMPILSEEGKKACSEDAMSWYQDNCSDFKGAAL